MMMMNTKPHHQFVFAAGDDDDDVAYDPPRYMMNTASSSYLYDSSSNHAHSSATHYAYNYSTTTPDTDSDQRQQQQQQQHYYYNYSSSSASCLSAASVSSSSSSSLSHTTSPCSSLVSSNTSYPTSEGDSRKFGKKSSSSFAYRIRDHVKLGATLSETVKGKLSLGAWIVQQGGRGNIFKQVFGVSSDDGGEQMLKASQCYLSTTAGPIPGLLFISTHKLAFCSERSITLPPPASASASAPSHHHHLVRTPYKVLIPISKIKRAGQSENVNKPQQKYIEIVTQDDFEFWFMGFLRFEKAFTNLQKAISMYHAAQQN